MPKLDQVITFDTSELANDLERIYDGSLSLPTVSAVKCFAGANGATEIPIFLEQERY